MKRHYTRLGVYKSLISPWKGKKEKRKLLQDGVFVICQASKQVLLNFVERKTGRDEVMSLWYYDSTLDHFLLLLLLLSKCIKERKKSLRTPGKIKNKKMGMKMRSQSYLLFFHRKRLESQECYQHRRFHCFILLWCTFLVGS